MAPALYDMSIPLFVQTLTNLKAILQKGEKWAKENNVSEEKMMQAKLADDMLPLTFQIQMACNVAKFVPARVAGAEDKAFEDNEKSFADLYKRLDETVAYLKSVKPAVFEGKESTAVEVKTKVATLKFSALEYLQKWVLPNHFFHATTAYAILRKEGVSIGKMDYLGKVQ